MAEKDITERALVSREEVMADLVNIVKHNGERVVQAADLRVLEARSPTRIYKKQSEEARDVLMVWEPKDASRNCVPLAHFGAEIQTVSNKYMALRIAGYDGADYHAQYVTFKGKRRSSSNKAKTKAEALDEVTAAFSPVPVYTMVLYFGLTHWNAPKSLGEALGISISKDTSDSDGFNDLSYPVFEVAFATPEQIAAMDSDLQYVAPTMVELQKLYAQRGVKIEDLDLTELMRVLPNRSDPQYLEDVEGLFEALSEDTRRQEEKEGPEHKTASQFIRKVFMRVVKNLPLGSDCVLVDLFPSLQVRAAAQTFWECVKDLKDSTGMTEEDALQILDYTGNKRAKYPRPDNFPDCFATTQPKPATVPSGGGPKPIVAMSLDAQ